MPIIIVISLLLYLLAGVILYHNLYAFEKPIKVTFIIIANTLGKKKENAITQASYQRRLVLLVMIFIIMLIWENGYSKNFQMGLLKSVL